MAYTITCTIDGVASSGYKYGGNIIGTAGTVTKTSNNTYRVILNTNFTTSSDMNTYIMCDTSITSVSIISGNSYYTGSSASWDSSWECIRHYNSTTFDVTVPSDSTYICIMTSAAIVSGSSVDYTFNGSTGDAGDGSANYYWYLNDPYTNCTAPTSVTVNGSSSAITTTSSTVTLAWSGASGGTNNAIKEYFIQYTNSTDGSTWDGWWEGWTVSSTATSGSCTVSLGDAGTYRKFKVWTIGTAGDDYASSSGTDSPVVYRSNEIPVIYNGTQLTKIIYNGTEITSLIYNGTQIF